MARTNATVTNCFRIATGTPTSLFAKVEARVDQYNSGDITADYVSAIHDQIAAEQKLVDDIRGQIAAKSVSAAPVKPAPEQSVQQTVQEMLDRMEVPPTVKVVPTLEGVVPGANGTEAGAHHKGIIYIASERHASKADTAKTLFHELFHYGLRKLLTKEQFISQMMGLYNSDAFVKSYADQWAAGEEGKTADKFGGPEYAKARGVDEALAKLAETAGGEYTKNGLLDKAYRAALRWAANVAEFFGQTELAANIRAVKNEDARAYIKDILGRATTGEVSPARWNDDVAFSKTAPANFQTQPAAQVTSTIDKLPPALRPLVRGITRALAGFGRRALNATVFTEDLLNRAYDIGMKAAKMYKDLANQRAAFTGAHERVVLDVVSGYNDLPDNLKGKGPGTVNQFLYDSTMQRTWGYQPKWLDSAVTVDPATETAYKALGAEGMAFVDRAFELGANTLAEKKKAVIEGATTEYNILIAHAKKAGNETEVAELEAEKIKTLKNFGSLMSISGREPYAPIKRFGNYVVQAMSTKYKEARAAEDRTKMRELEKQEEHYYVNFAETEADAERELDKLRATGNYDDPGYRERELARDDLYGGSKTLAAISNMRARVNAMAGSAAGPDAEVSKKMVKLLTDLYLTQLGEDTARKSEMNRRNIAGDVDMIRSLETQGLADARLLGSILYGQPMMESINDMRVEVKSGPASTHNEKSEVFNELMARHLQALDYQPTPWANKMIKATSLWFLATSPSYYIQNATQPWMMSLPMMAAKHGYSASGSALAKAYGDIAAGLKNARVFGQMEFDALLDPTNKALTDGEKEAVRKLLNSGRIDIGMLSELGEARVDPDGKVSRAWNNVDQGLRGMQLKLEAINRVTTALASYRLNEKEGAQAAYEYADDILQQTHGDYSAWNAPRAFNSGIGKVALQFRKYQLIQLTLMAKMLKNSFGNAPASEKAIARKALAYTLGQAFLVGGGKALPVPFVAAWLFAAVFGEGADEPPEYLIRQWIGNKEIADVLLDGVISAATGTNTTSIGGFGNALALAPFADFDLTNRRAATDYAFTLMSGPFGGLGLKSADGIGKILNGDLYGGLTNLAPKGVGSLMKAGDVATSGVTKRNGDLEMSPDEITAWDTVQQSLGFTPARQASRMYKSESVYKIDRAIDTDAGRITADFKKAVRAGDRAGMQEARRDWEALQSLKIRFGMKRTELKMSDAKPSKANAGLKALVDAN